MREEEISARELPSKSATFAQNHEIWSHCCCFFTLCYPPPSFRKSRLAESPRLKSPASSAAKEKGRKRRRRPKTTEKQQKQLLLLLWESKPNATTRDTSKKVLGPGPSQVLRVRAEPSFQTASWVEFSNSLTSQSSRAESNRDLKLLWNRKTGTFLKIILLKIFLKVFLKKKQFSNRKTLIFWLASRLWSCELVRDGNFGCKLVSWRVWAQLGSRTRP